MTITQYGPGDPVTWGAAMWPGDPRIDDELYPEDEDEEGEEQ